MFDFKSGKKKANANILASLNQCKLEWPDDRVGVSPKLVWGVPGLH